MAALIGTDMSTIAQAVEQQLLAFTSAVTLNPVIGSIKNIYWVEENGDPPAQITGQHDILFEFDADETENIQGDGRFAMIKNSLIVYGRTSLALDQMGTRRDWFIANDAMTNAIMDALMGFFPVDANDNALTVEGFVLRRNSAPSKVRDTTTWGRVIGIYEFHYIPNIDRTLLSN